MNESRFIFPNSCIGANPPCHAPRFHHHNIPLYLLYLIKGVSGKSPIRRVHGYSTTVGAIMLLTCADGLLIQSISLYFSDAYVDALGKLDPTLVPGNYKILFLLNSVYAYCVELFVISSEKQTKINFWQYKV